MGALIARKWTRLGRKALRHQLEQGCASSCIRTCFSCATMVFRYSKRPRTFFANYVPPEAILLEIPPCQTPMCGVAYSCSYVLLLTPREWLIAQTLSPECNIISTSFTRKTVTILQSLPKYREKKHALLSMYTIF